ncbi:MAG: radical SAM protein [Ruminococcus sp.]|nr:radical SAM protein [Ruminococcus sp.]
MNLFEEKVAFAGYVRIYNREKRTLIASTENNKCIMVSREISDIFKQAEKENLTFGELFDSVEDEASRELLVHLSEKLQSLAMWKHIEDELEKIPRSEVSIDITNNCNLRCKHCCISAGDNKRGCDLTTNELLELADRILLLNPATISVSGGEPLVRKDFREFTDRLRSKYKGTLILMTNAVLINNDEIAKYLTDNYDGFDISLDGYDEETCAMIRGEGVFEKVLNAVKLLQKYNGKISLSMVKTKKTADNIIKFSELCEKLGVKSLVRCFEPMGRGEKNKDLFEIKEDHTCACGTDWTREKDVFEKKKMYTIAPNIFSCHGAKTEFQIDQKGDVFPCPMFMSIEYKLFNILDIENPEEFISEKKYMESDGYKNFMKFMPYNCDNCKGCDKQLFCFSCAATVRKCVEENDFEYFCNECGKYYDMYWENHGTV